MNILIIKQGSIGDFVMSIGSIRSIRNKFPKNKIYLLTTTLIKNKFFKIPYVDQIFIDDRKSKLDLVKYLLKLRKLNISLIVDLQNSQRTEIYHLFTRIFFRHIRINSARNFAQFRYKIPPHGYEHVCEGLNNQLKLIEVNNFFEPNLEWLKNSQFKSPFKGNYVVLIPGSSKSGKKKRWHANSFSILSEIFINANYGVIFTGSSSDREIIEEIKILNQKVIISENLSKFENFINLCEQSSLIVSVDTGPAHIAALSNKPFIWLVRKGLYDDTNIPLSKNIHIIKADEMQNISVEEVVKTSKEILNIT